MKRTAFWAVAAFCAAVIGSLPLGHGAAQPAIQSANAVCRIQGSGDLVRPDDRCTPGAFDQLSKAAVCRHKQRPSLPDAERRRILSQYGFRSWTGRDGELDHRVPFFMGGRTVEDNLWPEAGAIPNEKDKLERRVWERVCVDGTMTVGEGRAVFLGDWTKGVGA
jgi:hypothetical protein